MAELLTEIGELFGKYRNERGDLEFFQKKLRKSDGHLVTDYNQFLSYHSRNVGAPDPEKNKFLNSVLNTNFDGDPSRRFYGWQVKVLDRLQNSNNDIYVVAPPGGGKTTPLMAHYMVDIFMDGKNGRMPSLEPEKILDNSASQDIIQKSHLNVTEWGTEAATTSTALLPATIATLDDFNEPYICFKADHPFVFIITESSSQVILFEGVFTGK